MNEFRIAIKEIMGDVNDEDLDNIFMKVDTNCDGSVDWVCVCHLGETFTSFTCVTHKHDMTEMPNQS